MAAPQQLGAYRLTGELGRGASGVVYRGLAPDGREVAVKVLNPATLSETGLARFEREARLSRELQHENLVRVFDFGVHQGHYYLVMELLPGVSLEERLRRGPLPSQEVRALGLALCAGLGAAHARGVLHRDLKPANVVLAEGRVVIVDFGLALDAGEERERLTKTGMILGSPAYMAPEQIEGKSPLIGPRTDVYGLGATLYEAMTGQTPFSAPTLLELAAKVAEGQPRSPLELNPALEPDLAALALRCLETEPEARYASVEEVAAALSGASPAGGEGGGVRPLVLGSVLVGSLLVIGAAATGLGLAPRSEVPASPSATVRASSSPAAASPTPASPPRRTARTLAEVGDHKGALALLKGETAPDLALRAELLLWRYRNLEFERGNRVREAIQEALALNPGDPYLEALLYHCWSADPEAPAIRARARGRGELLIKAWDLTRSPGGRQGQQQAIQAFGRVLRRHPRCRWAHAGRTRAAGKLARSSKSSEDYERCRQFAKAALAEWPEDPILTYFVAWADMIQAERLVLTNQAKPGRELYERALGSLGVVIEREPRWGYALKERGNARLVLAKLANSREQGREALRDLETAVALLPDEGAGWHSLGLTHTFLGQPQAAIKAYRRAIRQNVNFLDSYFELSQVYVKQGDLEAARKVLTDATQIPALSNRLRARAQAALDRLPQ